MKLLHLAPPVASLALLAGLTVPTPDSSDQDPPQQDEGQEEERPLAVGDVAPAFVLNDQAGKLHAVGGESEEWTILAFYPKALTGG